MKISKVIAVGEPGSFEFGWRDQKKTKPTKKKRLCVLHLKYTVAEEGLTW